MSIKYPESRANATNCKLCKNNGQMVDNGYISLDSVGGNGHRLLKRTCQYCGYTIFFDPSVAKRAGYLGSHEEIFPEV